LATILLLPGTGSGRYYRYTTNVALLNFSKELRTIIGVQSAMKELEKKIPVPVLVQKKTKIFFFNLARL
jgi:hypothetical protein